MGIDSDLEPILSAINDQIDQIGTQLAVVVTDLTNLTGAVEALSSRVFAIETAPGNSTAIEPWFSNEGMMATPVNIGGAQPFPPLRAGRITMGFELVDVGPLQGLISRDAPNQPVVGEGCHLAIYVSSGRLHCRMQTPDNSVILEVEGVTPAARHDLIFEFHGDKIMLGLNRGEEVVGTDARDGLVGFNMITASLRPMIGGALNWAGEVTNVMTGTLHDLVIRDIS